ncbi:hypothetical protein RRG08_031956 [Elysia crispata]|uniref:Uncharacterized protein n=1 Tax=Elysia crispata TaxID=231223 RepID=A0AAE1D9E2_9GAST|nr:hypothetical protein RRG08_031956 [Elysia crispata]
MGRRRIRLCRFFKLLCHRFPSHRSAPEFNSAAGPGAGFSGPQDTGLLRKTQSHPVRGHHHLTPSKALAAKNRAAAEEQLGGARSKSDRCRSTPGPLSSMDVSGEGGGGLADSGGGGGENTGKASCPSSPQDGSGKDFLRGLGSTDNGSNLRKASGDGLTTGCSSPKPKRTIFEGFRNTLGRKSKPSVTDTTAAAAAAAAAVAATSANVINAANATTGVGDMPSPSSTERILSINSNNNELPLPSEDFAAAAASYPSSSPQQPQQQLQLHQGDPGAPPLSSSTPATGRPSITTTTSSYSNLTTTATTTPATSSSGGGDPAMSSGRILFDYQAIKEDEVTVAKGELVQILGTNHQNMFLVHRPANSVSPAAEGWVPCHVIGPRDGDGSSSLRKGSKQMFKIKKPVFRSPQRAENDLKDGRDNGEITDMGETGGIDRIREMGRDGKTKVKWSSSELGLEVAPMVQQPLTSLTVQAGDTATLTCRVCGRPRPQVQWRYRDSQVIVQGHSPRVLMMYNEEGLATLQLLNVSSVDSGEYSCVASSDIGTVVTRAMLTVLDRPGPPGVPVVRNQVGTAVHLEWSPPSHPAPSSTVHNTLGGPPAAPIQIQGYTIEYREAGSSMWQLAIPYVPNTSQVIGDLEAGQTYQFRVSANNAIGISEPSLPSSYVAIPSEYELSDREDAPCVMWKNTFENDFSDLGEFGKGRFSVVHACAQKCSGQELAGKIITKRLTRKEAVETEFNTLHSLTHTGLVRVFDLYETPTHFVIIMELLSSGRLLEYICGRGLFDELLAAEYMAQLLDCLRYLHNCRIAHLDIKPENLMVECAPSAVILKVVDFGDARHIYNNYYIHPMVGHPEFTSPEVVSGTPVGLLTDIWSVGVLLYVLLSGVSPFLDESQEETCSNIVRHDFCFPDEYFAGISPEAKELIRFMLVEELSKRPSAQACLESPWIKKAAVPRSSPIRPKPINTARLADFIQRRKHQSDAFILKSLP